MMMTTTNAGNEEKSSSLKKCALQGAVVAAIIIMLSLTFSGEPNRGSRVSMLVPLVLMPLSGAVGGVVFYIMDPSAFEKGWRKLAAIILSVLAYCLILLVAFVIAMDGPD